MSRPSRGPDDYKAEGSAEGAVSCAASDAKADFVGPARLRRLPRQAPKGTCTGPDHEELSSLPRVTAQRSRWWMILKDRRARSKA